MNKDKSKSGKPNQKNKSLTLNLKKNISSNNTVNNNRNKNIYKDILSIKNVNNNNGLNRNIINDKISNKNIKNKKSINKLLTKFEEVNTDKLISLSKPLENKQMENKDILLKTSKDINKEIEKENINGSGIIKNKYKKLILKVFFTNYYKFY